MVRKKIRIRIKMDKIRIDKRQETRDKDKDEDKDEDKIEFNDFTPIQTKKIDIFSVKKHFYFFFGII